MRGQIVSVPDGFAFIGMDTVTCNDGSPSVVIIEQDIFLHQDDCNAPLRVGMTVSFEMSPDPKRPGALRAREASEAVDVTELVPVNGPVIEGFVWSLTRREPTSLAHVDGPRHPHARMKHVDEALVAQTAANRPMPELPRDEDEIVLPDDPDRILSALEGYLYTQYTDLHAVDMDYRIVGYDEADVNQRVNTVIADYRGMDMHDQAALLAQQYANFRATRRLLGWIWDKGLLHPGSKLSPSVLKTCVQVVESAGTSDDKAKLVSAMEGVVEFMLQHNLLRPSTVVPMRYLPDLLMAVPVWYLATPSSREIEEALRRGFEDPQVHPSTQYFCECVPGSQRWCDVFQMFNRRVRTLKQYKGDMIPPRILAIIREAQKTFDQVVIMTPYHDVAGADWENPSWLRSIDPYVVGFKKGIPLFFILARFSDLGVFPLYHELVGDTIAFLRANKGKLTGFNRVNNPFWHQSGSTTSHSTAGSKLGDRLIQLTDELLAAFGTGTLFDWLREPQPQTQVTRT